MSRTSFIENKQPDMGRVSALLEFCAAKNQWANRGPVYELLARSYGDHFSLSKDREITPCANAGVALEAISRRMCQAAGRKLRWVASAFSFQNLGRGHFHDVHFVDCTPTGLLDLEAVKGLNPDSFDGIIVVNPFGIVRDFSAYIDFARSSRKRLVFDNAAGIDQQIPDWPWQSFSLHQTKPYGVGEGGLALTPRDEAAPLYQLLNYGDAPQHTADWFNNGKLSDLACAFHLDRLERVDQWAPLYLEQAQRVTQIASQLDLRPLHPVEGAPPAMSWPFLCHQALPLERLDRANHVVFGKYYKPLAQLPKTVSLYQKLINIPTHPDMRGVVEEALIEDLTRMLDHSDGP